MKSMIKRSSKFAGFLAAMLLGNSTLADHMVYLDFGTRSFDLAAYDIANTAANRDAVRNLILEQMYEDYATYEVMFSTVEPPNGRFTRVIIGGGDPRSSSSFGTVSTAASSNGFSGTGINSWEQNESVAFVFTDEIARLSSLQDSNSTVARISRSIAGTASHEVGHILSLRHENAYNDFPGTTDTNVNSHLMATGSTGITATQRATTDRFFSPAISNEILQKEVKVGSYFDVLHNINGDAADRHDMLYGNPSSPTTVRWFGRTSNGSSWGNFSEWRSDAGDAGDIFRVGDVTGDGREDLLYGEIRSNNQVAWYVRRSTGSGLGDFETWSSDAGDAGDIFRVADIDGDGRDDLIYGRISSATQVTWFVRKSTGNAFGNFTRFSNDAGDQGDWFFVSDVNNDGRADLIYARAESDTRVRWWHRKSNGNSFGALVAMSADAGDRTDKFLVGDLNNDGRADLVYGRNSDLNTTRWFGRLGNGNTWGGFTTWRTDAGDAGDVHRLGDINGDGRMDLVYGEKVSFSQMPWYSRRSTGSAFGDFSTLVNDAGGEGFIYP